MHRREFEPREASLQALHVDLMSALSENNESPRGDLLKGVVDKMEQLLTDDTGERVRRLEVLQHKQDELNELHGMVEESERQGVETVTELCRSNINYLIEECHIYQSELSALRQENDSLQTIKHEFDFLRREGSDVTHALTVAKDQIRSMEPYQEKAEKLAKTLVQTVAEANRMEGQLEISKEDLSKTAAANVHLMEEVSKLEQKLQQFEAAAEADISDFSERDKHLTQEISLQVSKVDSLSIRCHALTTELSTKCEEVNTLKLQLQGRVAEEEVDDIKKQYANIIKEKGNVQNDLTTTKDTVRELQQTVRELQSRLAESQSELGSCKLRERDLMSSNDQMTAELTTANLKVASNIREIKELETNENASQIHLTQEYSSKCTENSKLILRVGELERTLDEQQQLVHRLKSENTRLLDTEMINETLQTRLSETIRELDERTQINISLRSENARLGDNNVATETLKGQSERDTRQKEEMAKTIHDLQKQTLQLAQEKGRLNAEVSHYKSMIGNETSVTTIPRLSKTSESPSSQQNVKSELEQILLKVKQEMQGLVRTGSVSSTHNDISR